MEVFQPPPQISVGLSATLAGPFLWSRVRVKTHTLFANAKNQNKMTTFSSVADGPTEASFAKRILILKVDHFFMKIAKSG